MAFKFVVFATLLTYGLAGVIPGAPVAYSAGPVYSAPIAKAIVAAPPEDYDPNPQYSYGYDIQDGLTGDSKSQSETRNGDVVQGSYSLVDPDGLRRIVEYTADPVHGFNAVVRREPLAVKAVPALAKVAAPVAYAAPAQYAAHPAPLALAAAPARLAYPQPAIAYHH